MTANCILLLKGTESPEFSSNTPDFVCPSQDGVEDLEMVRREPPDLLQLVIPR